VIEQSGGSGDNLPGVEPHREGCGHGHLAAWQTPPDAWELYPFLDSSDRKRLARTCNDIVRETAHARGWRGFLPPAIAIGHNGGGDKFILLPSEGNPTVLSEAIFWWDHETGEVIQVAEDFDELCERQER